MKGTNGCKWLWGLIIQPQNGKLLEKAPGLLPQASPLSLPRHNQGLRGDAAPSLERKGLEQGSVAFAAKLRPLTPRLPRSLCLHFSLHLLHGLGYSQKLLVVCPAQELLAWPSPERPRWVEGIC